MEVEFASFDSADERQISYYVDEEEARIASSSCVRTMKIYKHLCIVLGAV